MRTPSRSRALVAALVVPALLLGAGGCGGGAADKAPAAAAVGDPTSPATDAVTDAVTDEVPKDLCSAVTAAELSEALAVTVTTEVGPSGDCEFADAADVRGLQGSLGVVAEADTNGGYAGYVSGLDASMKNPTATQLTGLGEAGVVKVGLPAMGGSENLTTAGVVDHGSYLLTVTLVQGRGFSAEVLATVAEQALRLIDAKTS